MLARALPCVKGPGFPGEKPRAVTRRTWLSPPQRLGFRGAPPLRSGFAARSAPDPLSAPAANRAAFEIEARRCGKQGAQGPAEGPSGPRPACAPPPGAGRGGAVGVSGGIAGRGNR